MDPEQIFMDGQLKDAHKCSGWSWNRNFVDFAEMMYDAKLKE